MLFVTFVSGAKLWGVDKKKDLCRHEPKFILVLPRDFFLSRVYVRNFFFLWRCGPTQAMASSFLRFLDHAQ